MTWRIPGHTRDRLVGWGFSLAYVALMGSGLAWDAARLEVVRGALLTFFCGPAFALGVVLLLAGHWLPAADEH